MNYAVYVLMFIKLIKTVKQQTLFDYLAQESILEKMLAQVMSLLNRLIMLEHMMYTIVMKIGFL